MEESMQYLRNTISLYKHDLQDRGAFIENNLNLREERKSQLHFDSLLNIQQKQAIKLAQLQKELDSVEGIYNKRYKTK